MESRGESGAILGFTSRVVLVHNKNIDAKVKSEAKKWDFMGRRFIHRRVTISSVERVSVYHIPVKI